MLQPGFPAAAGECRPVKTRAPPPVIPQNCRWPGSPSFLGDQPLSAPLRCKGSDRLVTLPTTPPPGGSTQHKQMPALGPHDCDPREIHMDFLLNHRPCLCGNSCLGTRILFPELSDWPGMTAKVDPPKQLPFGRGGSSLRASPPLGCRAWGSALGCLSQEFPPSLPGRLQPSCGPMDAHTSPSLPSRPCSDLRTIPRPVPVFRGASCSQGPKVTCPRSFHSLRPPQRQLLPLG